MKGGIKKILPRTLFGRSLMILVTPILLIQIISTVVFFDRHWVKMTDRLAFSVAGEIAMIADRVEKDASASALNEIKTYAGQNLELLINFEPEARLEDERHDGHAGLKETVISRTLAKAMDAQVRRPYLINVDVNEKWVEVSVTVTDGVLRVSLPQRRLFSSSGYIFLLWMIAISLVLLMVAILFMRNQIRPIRRLAVAAERFGKGMDVPTSFKPEGAREVRQAASAFLDMQERIKRQIQQRTAMLAGVSHDLRTPLTRMKLQAAMLGNNPDVEALKSDIADMERMIDAYLDFARGEGGEQASRTDLKAILDRVAAGVRRQGVKVDLSAEGDLSLHMRPVAFERCLTNLVNNARKYGGDIWIDVVRGEDEVVITIDDNGPGIPDEKMEDVFRPFYRIDESRNPATGGVGLGLPIAQDIIHSHGGEIMLAHSPHGGLRVKITMPA
ncbi:MAG: HAMP domain-containing protein [Rhodospirillales bacterium]|nr:HAMP domain-containing protein [Rhodospirillales bacterium]MCB9995451.1 HAMP domain-containing protein [Rhodospirillales bacterium]